MTHPSDDVEFCGTKLSALSVQGGDVLVLTSPRALAMSQKGWLAERLRSLFPENESVILDEGVSLVVMRRGA